MVDPDIVAGKLAELAHRIERVIENRRDTAEALGADENSLDVVSFNLMLAVQACADIASHLIADEGWTTPPNLAQSFVSLREHGVITDETAKTLGRAVGLRNVVAHAYGQINTAAVHRAATDGIGDLQRFAAEVARWLSARSEGAPRGEG